MSRPPVPPVRAAARPSAPAAGRAVPMPGRGERPATTPRGPSGRWRDTVHHVRAHLSGLVRRAPSMTGRPGRAGGATDGAPRWASGLLAGGQAALLSFLVVVVPSMAAYVATSADPANAEIGWPRSVAVGAVLWLLGHGAPVDAGGAHVTLVPLGMTALAVFTAAASARRTAHPTRSAWLAGVGGYVALVGVVALGVGPAGPLGAGPGAVVRLLVGAGLVAAVGLGGGMVRVPALREATRPAWSRVPEIVRVGAVAGTIAASSLLAVAAAVTAAWVLLGRAATGDVVEALGVDVLGGAVLAVGQLALLPNLVGWALAWLAGPGFAIGEGTVWSPGHVVGGPLPALPLLGALPPEGAAGGAARWAPLLVVLCGALAGWWLHRGLRTSRAWEAPLAAILTGVTAGTLAAVATALSGGSAGPGRLAVVGGPVLLVGLAVAGLVTVGAMAVAVPGDPVVRVGVRRGARVAWAAVRGSASQD